MRRFRTSEVAVAIVLVLGLAAGYALAAGKGVLEGFVENEKSKPVEGAEVRVEIAGKPTLTTTTDANGRFVLKDVPVGNVKVRILAKGCYPWEESVVIAGKGSTHTSATLRLGVRLAGKATDERGAPIPGVRVRAVPQAKEGGDVTWADIFGGSTKMVRTGNDGTFQIDGLAPARRYQILFKHAHHQATEVKDLPGKAGAVKEGIEVQMKDAAWVTGVVSDATGKAVAKARIGGGPDSPPIEPPKSEESLSGERWFVSSRDYDDQNLSDEQGRFTVGGLTATDVEVVVDADGWFVARVKVESLQTGKETPDVHVTLEPANAILEGWVVDKGGKPVPNAYVTVVAEDGEVAARGNADQGGNFRFAHVRAKGLVTIKATAHGYAGGIVKGAALNKRNVKVPLAAAPLLKLKVTDPAGAVIQRLSVSVRVESVGEDGMPSTDWSSSSEKQEAGGLLIPVGVGQVTVEVSAEDYATARAGPFTAKSGQTVDGGTLVLKPDGK